MCISTITLHEYKKNCCELPQYTMQTLLANLEHVSAFTQPGYGHCPFFSMPCLQFLHFLFYAGPHSCVTLALSCMIYKDFECKYESKNGDASVPFRPVQTEAKRPFPMHKNGNRTGRGQRNGKCSRLFQS